ncbi:DNA-binding transcriptional MocR family regulator [Streptomyces olivoverticillatus]|uniref:DNA-binding transcriptional MocR family regulator n=1 Tax=Streptomyces olivoverticillatus TaxID=66427 RepID=A0A7W7PMZ8_9ACTN|nr:DNA-binding transcriptional MocR family regulator [Streptomyces olivoverticillatus]
MDRNRETSEPAGLIDLLGDWSSAEGPLYQRLTEAFVRAVRSGDLCTGDRLPSERRLADALSVSRATVVAAYDALRGSGLVETRRGSGTRVSGGAVVHRIPADGRVLGGQATTVIQRLVEQPPNLISLGQAAEAGGPDLAQALLHLVREDLPGLILDAGYHPAGLPALRAAIAAHHTAHGLPTVPDQVVVTTGATQAVTLSAQLYLGRGSTTIVESPGWPGCQDVLRAAGSRLVGVELDSDGIRIDRLATALAEHRPALLYLMPTYHNPTGTLMSAGRRRRVTELASLSDLASRAYYDEKISREASATAGHCSAWPDAGSTSCSPCSATTRSTSHDRWQPPADKELRTRSEPGPPPAGGCLRPSRRM